MSCRIIKHERRPLSNSPDCTVPIALGGGLAHASSPWAKLRLPTDDICLLNQKQNVYCRENDQRASGPKNSNPSNRPQPFRGRDNNSLITIIQFFLEIWLISQKNCQNKSLECRIQTTKIPKLPTRIIMGTAILAMTRWRTTYTESCVALIIIYILFLPTPLLIAQILIGM